jgi:hypothetical protein
MAIVHYIEKRYVEWLVGDDTGTSSETLLLIHVGILKRSRFGFDAPHDPSDFGRCYRLVKKFPEIKGSFHDVSKRVPVFAGILENWDSLCKLYRKELKRPDGRCPELYAKIKELRAKCASPKP